MTEEMQRFYIDSSETDVRLDILLVKKKIKKNKLAVVFLLALIIVVAVFNVFLLTILTSQKEISEKNHESIRTENNAIEEEIRTLNKTVADLFSAFSKTNHRANEIEERTNKTITDLSSAISKTINHRANEIEERTNKTITDLSSTISKTNFHAIEMEEWMKKSNDEVYGKINGMSSAISELKFKVEKKNLVFKLVQKESCLDTLHGTRNTSLELFPCHDSGGNQAWQFTVDDELRNRDSCLTFTNNTASSTVQVILNKCNGSPSQKCEFISGTLQSTEYDVCVQTEGKNVFAAKCNSSISTQKFEEKLLYKIDRICTFKQGSSVLLSAEKVIVAHNGFLVHKMSCLDNSMSWKECETNSKSLKWKYTDDGQVKNVYENVCVEKTNNGTVAVNTCDLNSESQKWICDRQSI